MSQSQLYSKLAVERCRVYVAQLTAVYHLTPEDQEERSSQEQTLHGLLKGINEDLDLIEQNLDVQDA